MIMKTQPNILKSLALLFITTLLFVGCGSDDTPGNQFSLDDLSLVHGNSEKTWKITAFYSNYDQQILHDFNDCFVDDLYTFKSETETLEVQLGPLGCYWNEPEVEDANITYSFNAEAGQILLQHGRGESNGDHFASNFFFIELQELSSTSMLFADNINGRLVRALKLEKVD